MRARTVISLVDRKQGRDVRGTDLTLVRERLQNFATGETAELSPLYTHLALHSAQDDVIAGLLTAAQPANAMPTLLLAAAHRLLHAEPFHELANYYPSLGGTYGVDALTWPLFRDFVVQRADRMRELIATRTTHINEVRQAALLYPGVALASRQARSPIGLFEVGTCAGLLLLLDRFNYRYQTEKAGQLVAGPVKSPLGLHCALEMAEDAQLPALPKNLVVGARVGLDKEPVDVTDPDQFAWLEACVWADQPDRVSRLGVAANLFKAEHPKLVRGDAVDDLVATARLVPHDLPLVVMNSNTLGLLPPARRMEYLAALAALSRQRPLWWVSHEPYLAGLNLVLPDRVDLQPSVGESRFGVLGIVRWNDGIPRGRALARTDVHGRRLEWLPG